MDLKVYLTPWKKYFVFSGRATRKEFWTFALVNFVFFMIIFVGGYLISSFTPYDLSWIYSVFLLITLLPSFGVMMRRFHDAGYSGWWSLLIFAPGGIVGILVFMLLDPTPGPNKYEVSRGFHIRQKKKGI